MLKRIKQRIKDRAGFSLVELLMVVIIVLLISAVVAAGIPAAIRAYSKVVDTSNAEVLLSTTITRLQEELGTATNIEVSSDKKEITYDNSLGIRTIISLYKKPASGSTEEPVDSESEDVPKTIYIQEYVDATSNSDFYHPLVSDSAASKKLYATYDTVIDNGNGTVTFTNLKVHYKNDKEKTLAELSSFSVRVLTYTA